MTFTMHLWSAKDMPFRVTRRRYSSVPSSAWRPRGAQVRAVTSKALTTVFYSTVMASACAADVHMKRARRQKLDEEIATLEKELGKGSKVLGCGADTFSDEERPSMYQLFRPCRHNPSILEPTAGYFSQSIFAAPSSIYSDRAYRLLNSRPKAHGWTPKKCLNVELAVAHMSTRMMLYLAYSTQLNIAPPPPHTSQSLAQFKAVLADLEERLQDLKCMKDSVNMHGIDSLRFPHYEPPEPGTRLWATRLNRTIRQTLHRHSTKRINDQQAITRLAYDLMVSRQAPDNRTFTNLISYFSAMKKHELVEILVQGLEISNIRKDEMAVNAVLTHYVATHNYTAFSRFAEKIKGRFGGLMQAQPNVRISPGNETLKASSKGTTRRVVEDQPILSTLISGYLRFGLHSKALTVYREMLDKGFQPAPTTLNSFLWFYSNSRLRRRKEKMTDAEALDSGFQVWHHILALRHQGVFENSSMANAYDYMLSLCRSCGSESQLAHIERQRALDVSVSEVDNDNSRPWFHRSRQQARSRRRKFVEVENVMARLENDLRKATARVLASKLLLAGNSTENVQRAFDLASTAPKPSHWPGTPRSSRVRPEAALHDHDESHAVKNSNLMEQEGQPPPRPQTAPLQDKKFVHMPKRPPIWQHGDEPASLEIRTMQKTMNFDERFSSHLTRSRLDDDMHSSFAI